VEREAFTATESTSASGEEIVSAQISLEIKSF
jgi:hypothetical protein